MTPESPTALVVDDNDAMRYVVGRMLRDAGFRVLEAATGGEALSLSTQLPDVVVLDINLPDMSGLEVCQRLKRNPDTSSIPVVHLSAQAVDAISASRGLAAGADAYLTQPIPREELVTTVAALVGKYRARDGLQAFQAHQFLDALWERNQTMAAMVQACPLAIVALDRAGLVTAWNAAAQKIFGWSEAEVLGRIVPYFPDSNREGLDKLLLEMEQASGVVGYETTRKCRDGRIIEVSISRAPLSNSRGEVTGCIVVADDISERKRSERMLQQSEKMIVAARLAATLAHEINNPLESLTNVIYLLQNLPLAHPSAAEYLAMAQTELARISSMSRQLLGFFRDTASPVQVDVKALLDDVLAVFSRTIDSRSIIVTKDYSRNCQTVAFPGELRHIFSNLISNALHAVPRGGALTVRVAPGFDWRSPRNHGLRVTITDNGPGIPTDIRSRIFEPFFTTKADHGTGLGLWIVQSIVQKHGGGVRVRSSAHPGRSGTSFSVFLPHATRAAA